MALHGLNPGLLSLASTDARLDIPCWELGIQFLTDLVDECFYSLKVELQNFPRTTSTEALPSLRDGWLNHEYSGGVASPRTRVHLRRTR